MASAAPSAPGFLKLQAASSTITRPADTTAYAAGDLVANSTTATAVNALQFAFPANDGSVGEIKAVRIHKTGTSATNAAFRLHLFTATPTFTSAGDNSAISTVVVGAGKGYLGYLDVTAMTALSDGCWGTGAPDNARLVLPFVGVGTLLYGFLEARANYTPANAEVFTVALIGSNYT